MPANFLMDTMLRLITALLIATTAVSIANAQDTTRVRDTTLTQLWKSDFGYSVSLPAAAKFNSIGSVYNKAGEMERRNYILPGGNGAIKIDYVTERRMV